MTRVLNRHSGRDFSKTYKLWLFSCGDVGKIFVIISDENKLTSVCTRGWRISLPTAVNVGFSHSKPRWRRWISGTISTLEILAQRWSELAGGDGPADDRRGGSLAAQWNPCLGGRWGFSGPRWPGFGGPARSGQRWRPRWFFRRRGGKQDSCHCGLRLQNQLWLVLTTSIYPSHFPVFFYSSAIW